MGDDEKTGYALWNWNAGEKLQQTFGKTLPPKPLDLEFNTAYRVSSNPDGVTFVKSPTSELPELIINNNPDKIMF